MPHKAYIKHDGSTVVVEMHATKGRVIVYMNSRQLQ